MEMRRRGFLAAFAALPFVGSLTRAEPRQLTTIKTPWLNAKTGKPVATGPALRPCDVGHFVRKDGAGRYTVEFFDMRDAKIIPQPAATKLTTIEWPGGMGIDVHLEWL